MRSPTEACDYLGALKGKRAVFEPIWRRISDTMRPERSRFSHAPGLNRAPDHDRIFDSSPLLAVGHFQAGMISQLTSPAQKWFALTSGDPELDLFAPVQEWITLVTELLLRSLSPARATFYKHLPALYADVGCFGNGVFYSEGGDGRGILDSVRALDECYAAEAPDGRIDTVYREFSMTARAMVRKWGADAVPAAIATQAGNAEGETQHTILHAVEPDPDPDARFPWSSQYICVDDKHRLEAGGYYELPFNWIRWSTASGETYGTGPGHQVLADVETLNQARLTAIKAQNYAADPPLAADRDSALTERKIRVKPGKVIFGGMSGGRRMIEPLYTGAQLPMTVEFIQELRAIVRDGFHHSLWPMQETPRMTATEVMSRESERARLTSHFLVQMEADFLAPAIGRRFALLDRAGQIPEEPEELRNAQLDIHFVSPLATQQSLQDGLAAMRTAEAMQMVAQTNPEIMDDLNTREYSELVAKAHGIERILHSREEAQAIRGAREQAAQEQEAVAALPQVAGAAKDAAQVPGMEEMLALPAPEATPG